ncbi:MAG: hypothetical protein V4501_01735 [Pseudomonadota bacterium]
MSSPAWPHSEITEIFPNIFMVMGTNITSCSNVELQHSRNMIMLRDGDQLSLINTVRLTDAGLAALDALGKVSNVIRIGAFHGRDDAFYLERYDAKLWALAGMQHENNRVADFLLQPNDKMPWPNSSIFIFETSAFPEGILHIADEGGILITCDSIKNWVKPDRFFSTETAKLYEEQGLFGVASIAKVWLEACQVKPADFDRLKFLKFNHLLSAHGAPLMDIADKKIAEAISGL